MACDILCKRREHDVKADAYSLLIAPIGIDGMLEIGWEYKKRAVPHLHDNLIGILGGEFRDRWPDNCGLNPRVVKIYSICFRMSLNVVNTAQEVVRMSMRW